MTPTSYYTKLRPFKVSASKYIYTHVRAHTHTKTSRVGFNSPFREQRKKKRQKNAPRCRRVMSSVDARCIPATN